MVWTTLIAGLLGMSAPDPGLLATTDATQAGIAAGYAAAATRVAAITIDAPVPVVARPAAQAPAAPIETWRVGQGESGMVPAIPDAARICPRGPLEKAALDLAIPFASPGVGRLASASARPCGLGAGTDNAVGHSQFCPVSLGPIDSRPERHLLSNPSVTVGIHQPPGDLAPRLSVVSPASGLARAGASRSSWGRALLAGVPGAGQGALIGRFQILFHKDAIAAVSTAPARRSWPGRLADASASGVEAGFSLESPLPLLGDPASTPMTRSVGGALSISPAPI
jgi:hypothetical protein